ncbi:hypothetical protein [Chthonobacter rhizosphaerae]|uniref:hypothetical protein n=1 Tax=Chthonobacter rhizosphaerae TaxID=2735553 RepID=UPI0015EF3356|nr:hypothetical protein [Chthonobacter rhizosphaerae]
MDPRLIAAWTEAMSALLGPAGPAEDAGLMAAQLDRASGILARPPVPTGSLFEREPSSHAAALLRLAPGRPS